MSKVVELYKADDAFREVADLLFGGGADELIAKKDDRRQRMVTAGLSGVGAAAGTAGLAYGGRDMYRAVKAGKKIPKSTKALVPLEVAGLGGELMATKLLHGDVKQKKFKPVAKAGPDQADLHVPSAKFTLVRAGVKAAPKVQKSGGKLTAMANQKVKEITKSTEIVWEGEFSKVDTEKRQVFGWASIVKKDGEDVIDLQGDYISIEEIEKSAYDYVVKSRKGGNQHQRAGEVPLHVSDMIESFIVTPEKIEKMGLPEETPLGWWVGYQINDDETWQQVKSGKRTGFSIHGRGVRSDA